MIQLPRVKIAHLPTPVEAIQRIEGRLDGVRLLIKRDDQTGLAFGGNKTRKLEFLVAAAQAHGAGRLITTGAIQSNHCRQTAAVAARYGMRCTLVLAGEQPSRSTGNQLLDHLLGADIIYTTFDYRESVLKETFEQAWDSGERPYLVPYGGSSPIGAAAYAYAMEELLSQGYHPDWIVHASSSGGTQAGLVVGAELLGYGGKILGISVDRPRTELAEHVANLASETADRLGRQRKFSSSEIMVNDDYLGAGYGVLSALEADAIQVFARQCGLLLDPVYTGRAAGGLLDLIQKGYFTPGSEILFWHTGGGPALFADKYQSLGST